MKVPKVGSFVWNELMTRNSEAVQAFYKELFGWEYKKCPVHGDYAIIGGPAAEGKDGIGGIMQMGNEFPADVKPHWVPYVYVEDVDETAATVLKLGGIVHVKPTDIPQVGRFAVIQDPAGATISILSGIK